MGKNNIRPQRLKIKKNIFVLQLESMEANDQPNGSLREAIQPYMFEAGLDPDLLANNTHLVAEGLMLFNVIDRRCLQLEDIKSGTLHMHPFCSFCSYLHMCINSF